MSYNYPESQRDHEQSFLVLPRLLALCLMMPLLTLYADAMGILEGAFRLSMTSPLVALHSRGRRVNH